MEFANELLASLSDGVLHAEHIDITVSNDKKGKNLFINIRVTCVINKDYTNYKYKLRSGQLLLQKPAKNYK